MCALLSLAGLAALLLLPGGGTGGEAPSSGALAPLHAGAASTGSSFSSFSSFLDFRLPNLLPALSGTRCPLTGGFNVSSVFGSGMVLQRDVPTRVWGWAAEGCEIGVTLLRGGGSRGGGSGGSGPAGGPTSGPGGGVAAGAPLEVVQERGSGLWFATLPPLPATEPPGLIGVFAVGGGAPLLLEDVVWGEVIVCGGQSNMAGYSQHSRYGPGSTAVALTVEGVEVPLVFASWEQEKKDAATADAAAGAAARAGGDATEAAKNMHGKEEKKKGWKAAEEDSGVNGAQHDSGVRVKTRGGGGGGDGGVRLRRRLAEKGGAPSFSPPPDPPFSPPSNSTPSREAPLPIRVFQIGEKDNWATGGPLNFLASPPAIPWAHAPTSLAPAALHLSGVCYFTGRGVAASLGGSVPVGLIEASWGGSFLQSWLPAGAHDVCGAVDIPKDGWWSPAKPTALFNSMIAPLALGPMPISGIAFYQGESQANFAQSEWYACAMPMLVATWRSAFASPSAWFAHVQIHGWVDPRLNQDECANLREVQRRVADGGANPGVACVTAVDLGDADSPVDSIHPRFKRTLGARLADAARAIMTGLPPPRGPAYLKAVPVLGRGLTVRVFFEPDTVGEGGLVLAPPDPASPSSMCPQAVPRHTCKWFAIKDGAGNWHNASASIGEDGATLLLTAEVEEQPAAAAGGAGARALAGRRKRKPVATENGWGLWPVATLYNAAGLPAYPWRRDVKKGGKV